MADLTVQEKLLLAASDLEAQGKARFSAEDLVVAAWQRDPEAFGLAGYPDEETGRPKFPNANRVFVEIMGSKPLRKQGLLVKAAPKTFALTEAGRQRAAQVSSRDGGRTSVKASLPRETIRELQKLLSSRAVKKYLDGRRDDITFTDAAGFWGISARSSAMEFSGKTGHVEATLRSAAEHAAKGPIALKHGDSPLDVRDVNRLLELHKEMLERFSNEISYIKKRTDER